MATNNNILSAQIEGRELSPWEDAFAQFHDLNILNNSYVFFLQSEEPITEHLLKSSALMLCAAHPMLRMCIAQDQGRRYFRPMSRELLDVKSTSGSWEVVHVNELSRQFDLRNGPLWRIRLLENESSNKPVEGGIVKTTVICTFFQGIVDGNAVMRFIDRLLANMESIRDGTACVEEEAALPLSVEAALQLPGPTAAEKVSFQQLVEENVSCTQSPYTARFGVEMARNPSTPKDTRLIPIEFHPKQTARLRNLCRKHKTTVNGALTAAAAIAMCKIIQGGRLTEEREILAGFAANMRRYCKPPVDPASSFANYAPDIEFTLTVPAEGDRAENFWKYAAKCKEETTSVIEAGEPQLILKHFRYMKETNYSMKRFLKPYLENEKGGYREDVLFFMSNLGNIDYLAEDRKFQIVGRHCACENALMGPTFSHYIATIHGRLLWSLVFHSHVTRRDQAQEYADEIVSILERAIDIE